MMMSTEMLLQRTGAGFLIDVETKVVITELNAWRHRHSRFRSS